MEFHIFTAKEALLLVTVAAIGLGWETVLKSSGVISFAGQGQGAGLAPLWAAGLWMLYACTINNALRVTKRSWLYSALAGTILGTSIYFIASIIGAVTLHFDLISLAVIAAGWAALLPALNLLADTIIDSEWLETARAAQRPNPAPRVALTFQSLTGL